MGFSRFLGVTIEVNDVSDGPDDRPNEVVQEFVDSGGQALRSDARGVLRGVKLLGLRSRNGRRYTEAALRQAVGLYEGSKVNVNHPTRDPLAPRDYRDRLGVVRNVRLEPGEGLFGDLHYNPRHALAEQLAWDADNAPQNVGLSHNVLARTRRDGGETVVESITRVQSVDLVADPATTTGLYEQVDAPAEAEGLAEQLATLCEERDQLREQLERVERRTRIDELMREHQVESSAIGEALLRQLMVAPEDDLAGLIEERARVARAAAGGAKPESRERVVTEGGRARAVASTAEFVERVSRRVA